MPPDLMMPAAGMMPQPQVQPDIQGQLGGLLQMLNQNQPQPTVEPEPGFVPQPTMPTGGGLTPQPTTPVETGISPQPSPPPLGGYTPEPYIPLDLSLPTDPSFKGFLTQPSPIVLPKGELSADAYGKKLLQQVKEGKMTEQERQAAIFDRRMETSNPTLYEGETAQQIGKRLVGAPTSGIEPPIEKLQQLARQGAIGKDWYGDVARHVVDTMGPEHHDNILKLFAETSTGADPAVNMGYSVKAYYQNLMGKKISAGRFPNEMRDNIKKIFEGKQPSWGPKKQMFYETLKMEADKHLGNTYIEPAMTVQDMWMARTLGYKNDQVSKTQYTYMDKRIKELAKNMGIPYWQAQAQVWTGKQMEMDRVSKTVGQGLGQLEVTVHSEYICPEDENLTLPHKQLLSEMLHQALTDKDGRSLILKEIGILGGKSTLDLGGWEGSARPSIRSIVYGNTINLDKGVSLSIIKQCAAALGYVLGQDSVLISKSVQSGGKDAAIIHIGRPLNIKEADFLAKELKKEGILAFGPSQFGAKVINFDKTLTKDRLRDILIKIAESFGTEFGIDTVRVRPYKDHAELVEKGKNGKGYSRILAVGPSRLRGLERLRSVYNETRQRFYSQIGQQASPVETEPEEDIRATSSLKLNKENPLETEGLHKLSYLDDTSQLLLGGANERHADIMEELGKGGSHKELWWKTGGYPEMLPLFDSPSHVRAIINQGSKGTIIGFRPWYLSNDPNIGSQANIDKYDEAVKNMIKQLYMMSNKAGKNLFLMDNITNDQLDRGPETISEKVIASRALNKQIWKVKDNFWKKHVILRGEVRETD